MDFFQKAYVVRLRSYHDKYMLANDDQETVFQDRNGTYRNAKWTVEIVDNGSAIRLKSCYGKYLTASNMPFMLKSTAKKVLQSRPSRLDSSLEWEPIREGFQVRLRTRYGHFLRGNGGLPPWRNTITHDVPHRTATANWILWDVDIVELRQQAIDNGDPIQSSILGPMSPRDCDMMRSLPSDWCPSPSSYYSSPTPSYSEHENEKESEKENEQLDRIDLVSSIKIELGESSEAVASSPMKEGRTIFYDVGDENGDVSGTHKSAFFTFKGNSVSELREKLKEETGLDNIVVCCRNPLTTKLYPLRLHLPPNKSDMHVVVVSSSSYG